MSFAWRCPTCNHAATIGNSDREFGTINLLPQTKDGLFAINYQYIRCPNGACLNYELTVRHLPILSKTGTRIEYGNVISSWRFHPRSRAQVFPDYVPEAIKQDYEEACLISELSPKASATLSRRCLQGILRDYWKVKPARLFDEIAEIKPKCDPLIWEAIESVRKVGNIGAHMEADVNVMLDVDPGEADLLIKLIETVVKDWYIARAERERQLKAVAGLARQKEAEKQAAKQAAEKREKPAE